MRTCIAVMVAMALLLLSLAAPDGPKQDRPQPHQTGWINLPVQVLR